MSELEKQIEKPDQATDPYGFYRYLRGHEPVWTMDGGPWQVARHEDVHRILKDHKTFSSDVSMRPEEERQPSMLFSDPPFHNRMRKLVSYAFKPSHIEAQRELVEIRCAELVADMKKEKTVDLVDALASPLPVNIIAHMLGVMDGDMKALRFGPTQFSATSAISSLVKPVLKQNVVRWR